MLDGSGVVVGGGGKNTVVGGSNLCVGIGSCVTTAEVGIPLIEKGVFVGKPWGMTVFVGTSVFSICSSDVPDRLHELISIPPKMMSKSRATLPQRC